MNIDTYIILGYYISSIGFLVATILMGVAVSEFGKSTLGSIFSYLLIGTGIFFVITIFQKLGGDFFKISDESMDIWWHIMFYMAFIFYFYGLKMLIGLGNADSTNNPIGVGAEKKWGLLTLVLLVIIFIIPSKAEPIIAMYNSGSLSALGLHHFIAFALAGLVGVYLVNAKNKLGQIGKAIANPMIIAILALSVQHFWELLVESWKVIEVTSTIGEGVEKIFLTISAIAMCYVATRLKSFAKA